MIVKVRSFFAILSFLLITFQGNSDEPLEYKDHKSPILKTTAIIEIYEEGSFKGIVLIERGKAPFGMAIPGGNIEYDETVETAVRREMLNELNLELFDLVQFHVYSEPSSDFRCHFIEVTHIAKSFKLPKVGDDAAKVFIVKLEDIPWESLAFDHAKVLKDYIEWKEGKSSLLVNYTSDDIIEDYFKNFEMSSTKGNWSDLLSKGLKALEVSRKEGRIKDEAKICAQLTSISFYQGNYDKALEYAKICHDLSEEFAEPVLFLQTLYLESAINKSLASKNNDEKLQQTYYSKAVEIAEYALKLYESNGLNSDFLKGKIYFNLGAAHADNPRGSLDAGAHFYYEALQAFESAKDIENQMRTQLCLGKVYLLQKSFEYTQKTIDKARSLITSKRALIHSDYLEAQLKLAMNDFVEAAKVAEIGLKKARSLDLKEDEMRFTSLLQNISNFLDG